MMSYRLRVQRGGVGGPTFAGRRRRDWLVEPLVRVCTLVEYDLINTSILPGLFMGIGELDFSILKSICLAVQRWRYLYPLGGYRHSTCMQRRGAGGPDIGL